MLKYQSIASNDTQLCPAKATGGHQVQPRRHCQQKHKRQGQDAGLLHGSAVHCKDKVWGRHTHAMTQAQDSTQNSQFYTGLLHHHPPASQHQASGDQRWKTTGEHLVPAAEPGRMRQVGWGRERDHLPASAVFCGGNARTKLPLVQWCSSQHSGVQLKIKQYRKQRS